MINTIATKEQMKAEALKRLRFLVSLKEVIKDFNQNDNVWLFERQNNIFNAVAYSINANNGQAEYDRLEDLIEEFEMKSDVKVYLVQLTHFDFGDCYSFFYVSNDIDEWAQDWEDLKENIAFVRAYTDGQSEYGTIGFKKSMGGITRTF